MGFFNPFYYLKYLLRRLPKKLLVFICIFLIICVCHLKGYCVDDVNAVNVPNYDVIEAYRNKMNSNWYRFVYDNIYYARQHNNTFNSDLVAQFRKITLNATRYRFGLYDSTYYKLYFKNNNGSAFGYDDKRLCLGIAEYANITDTGSLILPNAETPGSGEVYTTTYHPATCFFYQTNNSTYVKQDNCTVELIDEFDNYIPSDLYDIIYNIGRGSFDFTSADNTLKEISQKIDETNDQLEQMNDFFNSDTTPTVTPSDLPSDSMNDITASGFNGIFTKIYNEVTYDNNSRIKITIPYVNYEFYLYSNYLSNTFSSIPLFQNFSWGDYSILTFIQLLWSFAIYRYIVLDIYKYINEIKNGNISTTDTNIKADML